MRHFSCDLCGKDLTPADEARFVVRMEMFPAAPLGDLTEADLDQDHISSMSDLLDELEDTVDDALPAPSPSRTVEYDLCPTCHRQFAADPLGRERGRKPVYLFDKN